MEQVQRSLENLTDIHPFFGMSFLAFKRVGIPVGQVAEYIFTQIANDVLERHYKASSEYEGFYNPFITSDRSMRWLSPRYGSTSLQRITTDTFGDTLIHTKKTSEWGWQSDYINRLERHLDGERIPAFDLAVWLYRQREWPEDVSPDLVRDYFLTDYKISPQERERLFDLSIPDLAHNWVSETPISEDELLEVIGPPPGTSPAEGAAVSLLELHHIGPATLFRYEPAERLNIITGDNSLGKTFILECMWWALTGEWLDDPVYPKEDATKSEPRIVCSITTERGRTHEFESKYNWERQAWRKLPKRDVVPGLVIYARFDGSFAVWDPARLYQKEQRDGEQPTHLYFRREDIWDGLVSDDEQGRPQWLCNGLIRDWVAWQTGGQRYHELYQSLVACLKAFSPTGVESLIPGEPKRLPGDTREFPTLKMPYGRVPVIHASAGVQRIIALAYILVWSWHEHRANSLLLRRAPQRRLILIIDEIEAHLHARWQRVIVPALLSVIAQLASSVKPQAHLATHSPLVMASAEPVYNEEIDNLHNLKLVEQDVVLEEILFVKRGKADSWLMSDVFGLDQARSLPAEQAIEDAKKLQLVEDPPVDSIIDVNNRLTKLLAPDDEFWVRWRYFAKKRGLNK
ncbi:MAG TPA: AAA family ATPase [Pyrinomonadaceae bacterium]